MIHIGNVVEAVSPESSRIDNIRVECTSRTFHLHDVAHGISQILAVHFHLLLEKVYCLLSLNLVESFVPFPKTAPDQESMSVLTTSRISDFESLDLRHVSSQSSFGRQLRAAVMSTGMLFSVVDSSCSFSTISDSAMMLSHLDTPW